MVGLGQKLGTQAMDSEWPNPQHIFGGPTQPYNRQFYWKKNGQKLHYTYYSPEIRDFCFMKGSKIDETS